MKKLLFIQLLILANISVLLASCTFTRSDLLSIATATPDIHVIPNSSNTFAFGAVNVYTTLTQTFTVENVGSRTLKLEKLFTSDSERTEFILNTDQTASLIEPGETTTFSISFKPTARGQSSVNMVIESNDPDEHVYQFNVVGEGIGDVVYPPSIHVYKGTNQITNGQVYAHDFGTITVGYTSSVVFKITNDTAATADLFISDISFISGDVMQFNKIAPAVPGSLSPGGEMQFSIEFSPQADLDYTTVIEILSDDPANGSFTFSVLGKGGTPSTPVEQDLQVTNGDTGSVVTMGSMGHNFTTISVGSSATVFFYIENIGPLDLTIGELYLDDGNNPPQFTLGSLPTLPKTLKQGENFIISVTYNPTENRNHTAWINITSNDPDENPFSFSLQGKGTLNDVPDMQVLVGPKKYADGSVYYFNDSKNPIGYDGSIKAIFTIKNTGKADLEVSSILLVSEDAKDFATDLEVPVTLQTGSTADFNVWFIPQTEPSGIEKRKARIQLSNNDVDENPYNIDLVGYVAPD